MAASDLIDRWLREIDAVIRVQREHLTQLDAAIGDGDHGTNMARGFTAVVAELDGGESQPAGKTLIAAGKTLVAKVGGASGPLWGTALRRAGRELGDPAEVATKDLAAALEAALAGIKDIGAAELGDKTIVDALTPAVESLNASAEAGVEPAEAVAAAAAAAEKGAEETIPLQARKGRASYLGERSIGHKDPGATSTALILRSLEKAIVETR
jgi:dihydroxyacetone kinase-like protein